MKKLIKNILASHGKMLVDKHYHDSHVADAKGMRSILDEVLRLNNPDSVSRAQLKQDIIALNLTNFKKNGLRFRATL